MRCFNEYHMTKLPQCWHGMAHIIMVHYRYHYNMHKNSEERGATLKVVIITDLGQRQNLHKTLKIQWIFPKLYTCRKESPQKLTQLSSRSHPRHLVGKRTAQKDTIIDITSDSQVNSNFPNSWSPASLTFNNYFYLFLY